MARRMRAPTLTSIHQPPMTRRLPSISCFVDKSAALEPALTIDPESSSDEEEAGKGARPSLSAATTNLMASRPAPYPMDKPNDPSSSLPPEPSPYPPTPHPSLLPHRDHVSLDFEAANNGFEGRRFTPPNPTSQKTTPTDNGNAKETLSEAAHVSASASATSSSSSEPPRSPASSSASNLSSENGSVKKPSIQTNALCPSPSPSASASPSLPKRPPELSSSQEKKRKRGQLAPGLNLLRGIACLALGLAVQFLCPRPTGVCPKAWTLFSIFNTTVAGLVLEPLPVSPWSLICLCALLITKAATFGEIMKGFQSESVWLIVIAFFFARSFEKSGLGERVANFFVAANRSGNTLGLAYSLSFAEALIAPALPSSTARAGGIFMPVIKVVSKSEGSEPDESKGRRKMGSFLVHAMCQSSSQSSALFLTGGAQNLLAMSIAMQMGVKIPDAWTTWFIGASVPSLVGLLTVPFLVKKLHPPSVICSPDAPRMAIERLVAMGKMTRDELITSGVLLGSVVLWVLGESLGISAVTTAMIALSTLLASGVLTWGDCLAHRTAWDVLLWFSILVGMCSALAEGGVITAFASQAKTALESMNLHWTGVFAILHFFYFTCHYVFASQVGHVGALYGAFLAMMMAAGVPTVLAALSLGYCSNLFGTISHYASGPATVYYSSGYVEIGEVMFIGGLMGLRSLLVWGVVGMAWWKWLGWW